MVATRSAAKKAPEAAAPPTLKAPPKRAPRKKAATVEKPTTAEKPVPAEKSAPKATITSKRNTKVAIEPAPISTDVPKKPRGRKAAAPAPAPAPAKRKRVEAPAPVPKPAVEPPAPVLAPTVESTAPVLAPTRATRARRNVLVSPLKTTARKRPTARTQPRAKKVEDIAKDEPQVSQVPQKAAPIPAETSNVAGPLLEDPEPVLELPALPPSVPEVPVLPPSVLEQQPILTPCLEQHPILPTPITVHHPIFTLPITENHVSSSPVLEQHHIHSSPIRVQHPTPALPVAENHTLPPPVLEQHPIFTPPVIETHVIAPPVLETRSLTPPTMVNQILPSLIFTSPVKSALRSPKKLEAKTPKKSVTWTAPQDDFESSLLVQDGPLTGTVFYVDVASNGKSQNHLFTGLLEDLGAQVVRDWSGNNMGLTHVLFKDGSPTTLEKVLATHGDIKCVNVGWALDCEKDKKKVDETSYLVNLLPSNAPIQPKKAINPYTPARTPSRFLLDDEESVASVASVASLPNTPTSSEWDRSIVYDEKENDKENSFTSSSFLAKITKKGLQSCPPKAQTDMKLSGYLNKSPMKTPLKPSYLKMTPIRPWTSAKRKAENIGGITMAPPKRLRWD
ncbi:hypothetical protein K505DRAFT_323879 [Melanomma pulvis-pyrius CBS 109.77]|uniref:BRCT domain-containing protein n=1 Tax=Melanomma pulvis-pyrius CBS 109.77 TaxID=1314802 RepID=A0A6A6XHP1_9PLEO|nr:hypothetical protein K505DRAFT_323879 [Melanomma pulvis-pyrius CBS 109.77]